MEPTGKQFRKRNAILSYLQSTTDHPSAEMVYAGLKPEIPDLSLGTVYRNLSLFKQQGLITSVCSVHGTERFDAETAPHVHFVCDHCDRVLDLEQITIPEALTHQVDDTGCRVSACSLTFTGICRECQSISL